jgi:hypothetical protein
MPCNQISSEWGVQRIKRLSTGATLRHAWSNGNGRNGSAGAETSLIDQFRTQWSVNRMLTDAGSVTALEAVNSATGEKEIFPGNYFFSSAPVKELMCYFDVPPPAEVLEVWWDSSSARS